jgi:hypothetical protein
MRLLVTDRNGDAVVYDSITNPTYFDTSKRKMVLGKVVNLATLNLGGAGLAEGLYDVALTIYDASYPSGVVVGEFQAEVRPS